MQHVCFVIRKSKGRKHQNNKRRIEPNLLSED